MVEFLTVFIHFLVDLELEDPVVKISTETFAELNSDGLIVPDIEVSTLFLGSTEG